MSEFEQYKFMWEELWEQIKVFDNASGSEIKIFANEFF